MWCHASILFEIRNKIIHKYQIVYNVLTNRELSKTPAIIPPIKQAQLSCPISAGTETKVLVIGEDSWIISSTQITLRKQKSKKLHIRLRFPLIFQGYQLLYQKDISTTHSKYTIEQPYHSTNQSYERKQNLLEAFQQYVFLVLLIYLDSSQVRQL